MLKHWEDEKSLDLFIFCQKHIHEGVEILQRDGAKALEDSPVKYKEVIKRKAYEDHILRETENAKRYLKQKEKEKFLKIKE